MSNATSTAERVPAPPRPDDHHGDEVTDLSLAELPRAVYRFFYSKRVGLILILAMGVLTLLGVLFQQMPDGVADDPQSKAQWLDSVQPRYRGWTGILSAVGIFSVFSSIWFKAVTVLLGLSVLACTTHRAPALWRHAMRPHTKVKEAFFDHGRLHRTVTSDLPADEAYSRVRDMLAADRYRIVETDEGPGRNLFADRNRFAPFGTVAAHLAFILILIGVFITSTFGYRNENFTVTVGSRTEVGRGSGLAVEARSFSDTYHDSGRPKDYVSDLVLYKDGQQVAQREVRVNTPLHYGGYSFNQSFFGIAAEMLVADASGRTVYGSGVPLQFQTSDNQMSYGRFTIPEQRLLVYVVTAASGATNSPLAPGQARVEVYRDGQETPVASEVVAQGRPAKIGDLTYTFQRERPFTGLMVSKDPGAWWVWAGGGLLVLGTCLTMFLRHHRVWVRVHDNGDGATVRLASPDRAEVGFERHFNRYCASISADSEAEQLGEGDDERA